MTVNDRRLRRATDRVSTDESLELLAALAMEYALKNPEIDILTVEAAIMRARDLKVEPTGSFPKLKEDQRQ